MSQMSPTLTRLQHSNSEICCSISCFSFFSGSSNSNTLHFGTNLYIYIYILFSHLADAFIQSDLQMRTLEAIKPTKEQQHASAMTSIYIYIFQNTAWFC